MDCFSFNLMLLWFLYAGVFLGEDKLLLIVFLIVLFALLVSNWTCPCSVFGTLLSDNCGNGYRMNGNVKFVKGVENGKSVYF